MSEPRQYGPYSPLRHAGDVYFISGQVGVDPATKTAAADVGQQTHQALQNLQEVLRQQGLAMADVVKTTIFLLDIDDFGVVNEIYASYFPAPRPARSCVGVAALPNITANKLLVEIEAIAYKPDSVEQGDA